MKQNRKGISSNELSFTAHELLSASEMEEIKAGGDHGGSSCTACTYLCATCIFKAFL